MAQHFLKSSKARGLSLMTVMRMTEHEVEGMFRQVRWPSTNGEPVCPHCGSLTAYDCRRPNGSARWRCKDCKGDYSITSGTIFAFHKMPLRIYLAAVAIFCNEVKGKNALALSRDLNVQFKTAFVLAHKMREALAMEAHGRVIGGEGKVVEVDGLYAGGYIKPSNEKKNRVDRRLAKNQNGKRKCVVVIRERNGRTLTATFPTEVAGLTFIRSRVAKGTTIHADEAGSWNDLHASYQMFRINHQEAYSLDGACTNVAESFFSRLRRAEAGHHHHIAGPYLVRYAQESAWREDHRRMSNGEQAETLLGLAMKAKPSVDFCGYWQRNR